MDGRLRKATRSDVSAMFDVRVAVRENHLSRDQLASRGITETSIAESFDGSSAGWVAVVDERVVGFSIADSATGVIFALFVLPEFEGRGLGRALLEAAVEWLRGGRARRITLATGRGTRAEGFYLRLGWRPTGERIGEDVELELSPPPVSRDGSRST